MHDQTRAGSAALIIGWIGYIALMAVHPTRFGGPALGHISLNDAVHWTALGLMPFLAYGYVSMAQTLGLARPLPMLGLMFMLFSLFAGLVAGVINGLAAVEVFEAAARPGAESFETLKHGFWWLNQAFAAIHYAFAAIATGLFGLAWTQQSGRRGLGAAGVMISAGFLAWLATGLWRPDVHGALFVVLPIGAWTVTAAFALRKYEAG
ncbi:hypothetical protein [uncultured Brevundimonas sp.]|uniref:hypothetical protein n=1 Tax=uncultured Brevundimonas sp. TaxID=213418 RepID=UPI0030EC24D4|tara:strand:- start:69 stop:689 length:621 start_codon:yes stop_codon:yes gene_type:complete